MNQPQTTVTKKNYHITTAPKSPFSFATSGSEHDKNIAEVSSHGDVRGKKKEEGEESAIYSLFNHCVFFRKLWQLQLKNNFCAEHFIFVQGKIFFVDLQSRCELALHKRTQLG